MNIILNASIQDANLINSIVPPQKGINVGGGIHIIIPDNWADLISQGIDVPGCTYAKVQADGSLPVADSVQVQLAADPRSVALETKISVAAPVVNAAPFVVSAQVEAV